MANNLRKFNTYSDYETAELVKPAVSLIAATDEVYFDQKEAPVPPTPTFSGLTVYYNISDISEPTVLFNGGGSGSGSGSGSGGVLPSAMIIDGTEVEVTNSYQFSTTGEHIVNYSFDANEIPNNFFEGDYYPYVTKVEIGDSITSIGDYAFYNLDGMETCAIGSGVTTIGDYAFQNCTSLTNITIPNSVTSIGASAFQNCYSLSSCTIGNGVTSIGGNAFRNCSGLTSCTIGSGVISIGSDAFNSCSGLISINIPSGVTTISTGVFQLCSSLTSITIPNSVTYIGTSAFQGCSSLANINIPSGVTVIGGNAFKNCTSLTSMTVDNNNTIYDSRNNCNAIIETSTNTLFAGCGNSVIPNSVTSIGKGAFDGCSSLTSITIPDSVTSIGVEAFNYCTSLTSIDISSGVTSIGNWAFNGCSGLTSLTVNAITPPSLGSYGIALVSTVVIYVPATSVSAYQTDWSRYASQIQAIP